MICTLGGSASMHAESKRSPGAHKYPSASLMGAADDLDPVTREVCVVKV